MLTIHEGFPIKKMALYGSTAFIVGFAGTITMLREYAPKDESGNISVVHPSNKQDEKSNVSNQVPKKTDTTDDKTTADAAAPLTQSTPVAGSGVLSTRQASPLPIATSNGSTSGGAMTVAPAPMAPAPTVSSAPQPSSSSTSTTTTTTTQPAPTTTTPTNPLPSTPDLQQTVNNLTTSTNLLP